MSDLERQLRAYAESLDAAAPPVEELAEVPEGLSRVGGRHRRPWGFVLGAAAIAVVAVGSVAIIGSLRNATTEGLPTTVTAPVTSTTAPPVTVPQEITPSEYVSLVSDTPVYAGGETGDVGGLPSAAAGGIVVEDGVYHTVFSAGGSDDLWETVYHASSTDGSLWVVDAQPAVFPAVEGASDLHIGTLMRLDDGTWAMYYHVAFDIGGHGNHIYEFSIQRATAPSVIGPWTQDPDPILLPADKGTWDASSVSDPTVLRTASGWIMFYTGHGPVPKEGESAPPGMVGPSAMGMATSPDGVTWSREPLPVFTGRTDISWEDGAVARTSVAWTGDRYVVLYAGRTGGSRGLATSNDGVEWVRTSDMPVLTAVDVPRPTILAASLFADGNRLRLYVSNGGYRTSAAVYEMLVDLP